MFDVGAFAIVFDDQRRVLLSHRRDMDLWNLPGGGVKNGELPTEAVIREVKEETGLDVAVQRLVGVYGKRNKNEIVFAFVCRLESGRLVTTDEADAHKYCDPQHIPRNTLPKHVERIEDALYGSLEPVFRRQTLPSARDHLRELEGKD